MGLIRTKTLAAALGLGAVAVTIGLSVQAGENAPTAVAGGSGDSSNPTFTQPTVPAMSVNPTNMTMGATVTAGPPATSLATAMASPTYKATAAAGCVNNGQCP